MSEPQKSKIIVDSDWKSRVETEKETIKRQELETPSRSEMPADLPPASFPMLVSTLVTQALVGLGQLPDPFSGQAEFNLPVAGHFIDTLAVLEQKTKGNLSTEESSMLTDVLHQLRMAFVGIQGSPQTKSPSSSIEIP